MIYRLVLAIFVLSLVSCADTTKRSERGSQVLPGMTKTQVLSILGAPQNKQLDGGKETWRYCVTDYLGLASDYLTVVKISDGAVTKIKTYRNAKSETCERFLQTVE